MQKIFNYKMSYIEFDKNELANIAFSKEKEILRCSRTGAFASTTLTGINTRKYHGLFILPQEKVDGERHVLVSALNESIVIDDMEFHLGTHQYKGKIYDPKGNKYLQKFVADTIPVYYYRVGKFNFTKEILFSDTEERLFIRYTILDDFDSALFQFRPLLAFRQIHKLTHCNNQANTSYESIENGVKYCLYDNYTPVYIQSSAVIDYHHEPTWYYNFEYEEELNRGYDGHEDLINLGCINIPIKQKELYISTGTKPIDTQTIKDIFNKELDGHRCRNSYLHCLENAAEQFIVERNGKTQIMAGYPWFGRWGRDTFISVAGLTLSVVNKPDECKKIIDDMLSEMKDGLFPNIGDGSEAAYNSVDAPLWFFRALQQYAHYTHSEKKIWHTYGENMKSILNAYRKGSLYNIRMLENGLIYAGGPGVALTWMDAVVDGHPVTPRTGCAVEINALWYNAIQFSIEMAEYAKDHEFIKEWEALAKSFPDTFKNAFWSKEKGYLADYVNGAYQNFQVRPNMMIAVSLPYVPISEKIRQLVLKKTREELFTVKGIRTLSPNDPDYKGHYKGSQRERDAAYHQGTCWPWLLAPFCEGMLAVFGKSAIPTIESIYYNFDGCMKHYGISTVCEITDGDPPHKPNGCISQAWSVAALLYIKWLIDKNK